MTVLHANLNKNRDSCDLPGAERAANLLRFYRKIAREDPRQLLAAEREVLPAQNSDGEKHNRHGEIQQEGESRDTARPEQTPQRVDNQRGRRYGAIVGHEHQREAHCVHRRIGDSLRSFIVDYRLMYAVARPHEGSAGHHGPFGVDKREQRESGRYHYRGGYDGHAARRFQNLRQNETRQKYEEEINRSDGAGDFRRPVLLLDKERAEIGYDDCGVSREEIGGRYSEHPGNYYAAVGCRCGRRSGRNCIVGDRDAAQPCRQGERDNRHQIDCEGQMPVADAQQERLIVKK